MIEELIKKWRLDAETMRGYGADSFAKLLEHCVSELSAAVEGTRLELLTMNEAANESGYSYSAIQKLVADGIIPNAGEKGRPRVRRGDLPRKAATSSGIAELILRQVA